MTKAYFMNSASYLSGDGANDDLFSNSQGMGLVNMGRAFDSTGRILRDQLSGDRFTASGQSRTFTGVISDSAQPLRLTLAWTDMPGSTSGAAYVNNLDLIVNVGSNTYRGNVFDGANSTTGGAADTRNNVESVFLPAGLPAGTPLAITVRATNIAGDGVPNVGGLLDQDFALVCLNCDATTAPFVSGANTTLIAENFVPANGALDPGETVTVNFALQNSGTAGTANLVATLLPTGGVQAPSGPQTYGALAAGAAAVARQFTFKVNPALACGAVLTATLQLQDGATNLGTVAFTFTLGSTAPGSGSGSSGAGIAIPAGAPTTTGGPADPYPSTINLSGLVGKVAKVTVTLSNTAHMFPDDIDILLVGPAGQQAILMSDVGGGDDISNVTLTLDDAAGANLPDNSILTSGTFKPTNNGTGDTFPGPAPAGTSGSSLAIFNGTDPNGSWKLFVFDDASVDFGSIGGGWRLSFITAIPACAAPPADLAIAKSVSASTIRPGGRITYTLTYTNAGPASASGVLITDSLPISLTNVSYTSSGAPLSVVGGSKYVWQAGTLAPGTGGTITITAVISPSIASDTTITNTATIRGATLESNLSNNSASSVGVQVRTRWQTYLPLIRR
jgi:uncharacterized repeat protein (TIGR01451 family)